jgi:hypothetical protein
MEKAALRAAFVFDSVSEFFIKTTERLCQQASDWFDF